jgi:hypothetical protein
MKPKKEDQKWMDTNYVGDLERGSIAEACPPHRPRHLRLAG